MLFKALLPCNTSPSTDVKPLESAVRLIAVLAARLFLGQKSMIKLQGISGYVPDTHRLWTAWLEGEQHIRCHFHINQSLRGNQR